MEYGYARVSTREQNEERQRQAEGIAAARERGVQFGRRPKPRPPQLQDYITAWRTGQISAREAARQMKIAHATFLCWAREYG